MARKAHSHFVTFRINQNDESIRVFVRPYDARGFKTSEKEIYTIHEYPDGIRTITCMVPFVACRFDDVNKDGTIEDDEMKLYSRAEWYRSSPL